MLNGALFIGQPINYINKCLVYPPKVKDVVAGREFAQSLKLLTFSQEDIWDELKTKITNREEMPTPFQFLMINAHESQYFKVLAEKAFEFFIHEPVEFSFQEEKIFIGKAEDQKRRFLDEEEFFGFQNAIRQACGEKVEKPPEPIDPNEDPRIRRIKEKARERDRIKAKQGNKHGISLNTTLVAICCMGIGITPLNIGEISYAAIGPIMKMMQDKEKYDIDIRSLLAGASSKKVKPKYWIRNSNE